MAMLMSFRDGCLIVSVLLVLCCSPRVVLGDGRHRLGRGHEVLRCIDECDNTDIGEYLSCQRDCELLYGWSQHEEQRPGHGIDPRWQPRPGREAVPERTHEDEYERCIRRCEAEGLGGRGRVEGCHERCEELLRGGREREREKIPERPRQSEYERCLRRCEAEGPGGRGREARGRQCEEQCEELQTQERRKSREREHESIPERTVWGHDEYERCLRRCESEGTGGRGREGGGRHCEDQCEELRRAQERKKDWEKERETAVTNDHTEMTKPKDSLKKCVSLCKHFPEGQQRQLCKFRCQQQQSQRGEGSVEEANYHNQGEAKNNPYYFHSRMFRGQIESEHGYMRVLDKFSSRSKLLKGIENYRFAILKANPYTFMIPHHVDADCLLFVLNGRGNISLVRQENSKSYDLERGDVIRVPSGTMTYLINKDNEPIQIAKLILPVNTPGSFQAYFPVGSEDPESYYWGFSEEILEAAFRTPIDQLQRLFGQQRLGAIISLQEERLRNPREVDDSSENKKGYRHGASKSKGPFNLLSKQPIYSNNFGRFFWASPEETKLLRDIDVSVSFVEVNKGAMFLPHYNSRTTVLVYVQEGSGFLEMTCPHLASGEEEHQEIQGRYERVVSNLSPGDFFMIPAGHPISIVASQNENLRMVGFGINAQKNQRNFLAGSANIMNQIDREAKQLAFDVPAEEVERIFSNQEECFFAPVTRGRYRPAGGEISVASTTKLA